MRKMRIISGKFQLNMGFFTKTTSDSDERWNIPHIKINNPSFNHDINIDQEERAEINVNADVDILSLELRGDSGLIGHPYSNIPINE